MSKLAVSLTSRRLSWPAAGIAAAVVVTAAAAAAPAKAEDGQCFARSYSKAHLASHKKQRVVTARLLINYQSGVPQPAQNMVIQLKLRNPSVTVDSLGSCKSDGEEDLKCFFEGDGGSMHFSATDNADARVEMIRFDYETAKGFGALSTKKGADNVLILRSSSLGACNGLGIPK